MFFFVICLYIIFSGSADRSIMGPHPESLNASIPNENAPNLISMLIADLRAHLDLLDRQTDWHHEQFIPLDAEVEIVRGRRRFRSVTDLLSALRANPASRLFLVLGDPGSGKSVALRKLARSLLDESAEVGKIPVYINLKEWRPARRFTRERPVTDEDIKNFVLNHVRSSLTVRTRQFFERAYDNMFVSGRLFLILDSFDEIPAVLDSNEASWVIESLSEAITRLILGGCVGRGVVASRYFRRPKISAAEVSLLDIQPFSDMKISSAIDKMARSPYDLKRTVFFERSDLSPLARNPFTLSLLITYYNEQSNTAEISREGLFEHFIIKAMAGVDELLVERSRTRDRVIDHAETIAYRLFALPDLGLEIPLGQLREIIPADDIDDAVDILVAARLGRIGERIRAFSFVHRRFNEYFLMRYLLKHPEPVQLESIPTEDRWRDALVLYASVAPEAEAERIAEFCWEQMLPLVKGTAGPGTTAYLRGLHSLRFLHDAFKVQAKATEAFRPALATYPGFPIWIRPTHPKAAEMLAKLRIPAFTRRVRQDSAT